MVAKREEQRAHDEEWLSTHELKQRGWTATLVRDFLGPHDATRPNLMRLGSRRRLPPVKLYRRERVDEVESEEDFLVAQGRAMDARDRAERARASRVRAQELQIESFVNAWNPVISPVAVRRGAKHKAFAAHEELLRAVQSQASTQLAGLSRRQQLTLAQRLREKYQQALARAYPWLEAGGE
ncbi:hypothetical protein [Deinococcus peraridilitoris]|uniref:Uncharacterized protein n=1 Tax=Deinococcus peraridilitoris (strain DSM 19664 / LMG 22246 / CIP 109416 / KR-200) TaxID=937777 RepID=L0A1H5_DEIPD|nr:hypothetical protein [Deinococcus peraridilitoris]AFZ67676.1 hypothetical protein Deipe_2191 [Deinococcus peraridilitoris DSM 19664]